jgi:hypothetical protein
MKKLFTFIILIAALASQAQEKLTPASNGIEKKWLKDQQYRMAWYGVRDTAKIQIGTVETKFSKTHNIVTVVTKVSMKQMKTPWVDSTVAYLKNLAPIRHSSYNGQRDMVLNFGRVVTGFYLDKLKNRSITISDTTETAYFDSNLYPALIAWLPLKEGFKKDISVYDFNPNGKTGVLTASVQSVTKGTYKSLRSGERTVWIVTVSDELGGGGNTINTYFIDMVDRKLWQQQISAGGRKMMMVLMED